MDDSLMRAVLGELHTGQCLRDIATYWGFRSTVPGPGLQAASDFLCRRYRESGLEAEVKAYRADDMASSVDGRRNPLTWVPRAAYLSVVTPQQDPAGICCYADEPLCLISNSTSTPPGGIEAEVVIVSHAGEDAGYEGLDAAGKILLVDVPSSTVEAQARKRGAIGVVSDSVCPPWLLTQYPPPRLPEDVPDLVMWSTWDGRRHEHGLWGFNLSPRQGRQLRELVRDSAEPVILRAEIDADPVAGTSEVVDAYLQGTDLADEEVWLLAHSSEPGAEDNASGCCMAVEIGRTLRALIDTGVLAPPRRTIRFLHAVEVEGYLPHLQARQDNLGGVIAGLCFDCVGNDLVQCGGRMMIAHTPDQNASFVDALLVDLCERVASLPARTFTADTYAAYHWSREPFGGNDAFISDGFFDIPTPEMSTWPQKFYHSSQDTPDKLSAGSLGRSGLIAALYLYVLAGAGPGEALWMARMSVQDWKRRIVEVLSTGHMPTDELLRFELKRRIHHLGLIAQDAVGSAGRLAAGDPSLGGKLAQMQDELADFARREATSLTLGPDEGDVDGGCADMGRVYTRKFWQRPADAALSTSGQATLATLRGEIPRVDCIWPWINGRRSMGEIWERVQAAQPMAAESVDAYLALLESEGVIGCVE